jgi:hypothetical protein
MEEAFEEDQGPLKAVEAMLMIIMTMIITKTRTMMAAGIFLKGLRKSDDKRHCWCPITPLRFRQEDSEVFRFVTLRGSERFRRVRGTYLFHIPG